MKAADLREPQDLTDAELQDRFEKCFAATQRLLAESQTLWAEKERRKGHRAEVVSLESHCAKSRQVK
jgi:hypothetical protein